jgi:hypothetical protein
MIGGGTDDAMALASADPGRSLGGETALGVCSVSSEPCIEYEPPVDAKSPPSNTLCLGQIA